jgi:hypothetical protein
LEIKISRNAAREKREMGENRKIEDKAQSVCFNDSVIGVFRGQIFLISDNV